MLFLSSSSSSTSSSTSSRFFSSSHFCCYWKFNPKPRACQTRTPPWSIEATPSASCTCFSWESCSVVGDQEQATQMVLVAGNPRLYFRVLAQSHMLTSSVQEFPLSHNTPLHFELSVRYAKMCFHPCLQGWRSLCRCDDNLSFLLCKETLLVFHHFSYYIFHIHTYISFDDRHCVKSSDE